MRARDERYGPSSYAYSQCYDQYEGRRVRPDRGDHRRRPAASRASISSKHAGYEGSHRRGLNPEHDNRGNQEIGGMAAEDKPMRLLAIASLVLVLSAGSVLGQGETRQPRMNPFLTCSSL